MDAPSFSKQALENPNYAPSLPNTINYSIFNPYLGLMVAIAAGLNVNFSILVACAGSLFGSVGIEKDEKYAKIADYRLHYFQCLGKKGLR